MIEIEEGTGNVYADLGRADAEEMLVKAQLATKIGEIIKGRKWSQQQAAEVLGVPQSKLSRMLRGQFRGISEAKMLENGVGRITLAATVRAHQRREARLERDDSLVGERLESSNFQTA